MPPWLISQLAAITPLAGCHIFTLIFSRVLAELSLADITPLRQMPRFSCFHYASRYQLSYITGFSSLIDVIDCRFLPSADITFAFAFTIFFVDTPFCAAASSPLPPCQPPAAARSA